ncbi:MAG: hypothetical protein AB8F78_11185 [Saprospiraceae bacterium]
MKKTSTKANGKGRSEKLLLLAIMAVGILGLTFSYGSKRVEGANVSASASDTTSSTGKIQSDRMILNLNQRDRDTQLSKKITRF